MLIGQNVFINRTIELPGKSQVYKKINISIITEYSKICVPHTRPDLTIGIMNVFT